ncbi:MAG: UDP-N-acetylmuramate--L-alanine ligase [Paludibacteraceae bacterium]|nr:UDP-N-acetylmuramate--L-alanine ligase [Paludibacteraceae bacterium]
MCRNEMQTYFFLGIGGIGMSALARYFHQQNTSGYGAHIRVMGYDRTPSALTRELEQEGIEIIYGDDQLEIGDWRLKISPQHTLVVRTPAVPEQNKIYTYLRENGFEIRKRAEVLGLVTRQKRALCVAGTHGKTTTSTMLAHLLGKANAFLGGISMNYGTNLLVNKESEYVVVEADEYDRSFHHLTPYISVITAVDADHLDIYGTEEAYREAFAQYTSLITGALVMKKGIALTPRLQEGVRLYTYSATEPADFYASHIRVEDGTIRFDFHTPTETIKDIELGVPVWINIENAVAAMAVVYVMDEGMKGEELREKMKSFKGVWRRFNIHVNTPRITYIDDYAHHPAEIQAAINSIRRLYPERRLIGIFQPHLYTRTRDFAHEFREALREVDDLIVLPIYPAREKPIEGVTSALIGEQIVEKQDLTQVLKDKIQQAQQPVVVLTVGAGDIDRLIPEITNCLETL